jgi:hypothetical protein
VEIFFESIQSLPQKAKLERSKQVSDDDGDDGDGENVDDDDDVENACKAITRLTSL